MKRTITNTPEINDSIKAIQASLPALKESEIIPYCYQDMAADFMQGKINIGIWDLLIRQKFTGLGDEKRSPTRGCVIDDHNYMVVVTGFEPKNNDYAYFHRPGTKKAPLAFVTKLVLYYQRMKLNGTLKDSQTEPSVLADDSIELVLNAAHKAAELIKSGNVDKVYDFIKMEVGG